MHPYIHQQVAQARIDELIREAERHRLLKQVRAKPRGRSTDWRSRLAIVIRNQRWRWQPGRASEQAPAAAAGYELAPWSVGTEAAGSTEAQ